MVAMLAQPTTLADLMGGQRHLVLVGDVLEMLQRLPDGCVHAVICSPPYYQLRRYLDADDPLRVHEMGSEPSVEQFIARLVAVFDEVKRVLRSDGIVAINIGDSYAGSGKGLTGHNGIGDQSTRQGFTGEGTKRTAGRASGAVVTQVSQRRAGRGIRGGTGYELHEPPAIPGLKPKDLMLVPERFVIAMQADGWWVRSRIAWCLSGGTQVYVRSQKGDMSMTVRDMARLKPETLQVWNGERWTRVVRMWESTDQGDPLEIELRSGERIGCTPNHLWPTERGLLPASELRVGDRFKRVRLPEPTIPRKPVALDDEDIGWFVGLYLAEGCISGGKAISIASHVKETDRFERVKRIAQAFDGSATMRTNQGKSATITVYGRILRAIPEEYISGKGAYGKHLTNACWRRSDVFLRGLLDGYLHGDGHWDEQNQRWRLGFARNYEFAADIRTLCARLGVGLRLHPRFAKLNDRSFPIFKGEIRFTRSGSVYEKSDNEVVALGYSRGRKFWDIEVEDAPNTFALASGVLTHNCKRSPMPESVSDRPTNAWEPVYLFSKSATYFWDATAVRQPASADTHARKTEGATAPGVGPKDAHAGSGIKMNESFHAATGAVLSHANLRNVWSLSSEPSNYDLCGPCDRFFIGASRRQNLVEVWTGKRWSTIGRVCPGCGSASDWVQHFAAFPTALPRLVVQAATSEYGCCVDCGAPWRRVSKPTAAYQAMLDQGAGQWHGDTAQESVRGSRDQQRRTNPRVSRSTEHVAWEPTCRCETADVEPCVVLDPFAGSGSTNVAAEYLGRRSIAIDLSPTYAQLIRHRVASDIPRWAKPPKPARSPRRIIAAPVVTQVGLWEGAG